MHWSAYLILIILLCNTFLQVDPMCLCLTWTQSVSKIFLQLQTWYNTSILCQDVWGIARIFVIINSLWNIRVSWFKVLNLIALLIGIFAKVLCCSPCVMQDGSQRVLKILGERLSFPLILSKPDLIVCCN